MLSPYTLVDGSACLCVSTFDTLETKEELFTLLRTHLRRLFKDKSDDEKLFWATYSYYRVYDDGRFVLCSGLLDVCEPIYDVSVKKSEQTSICVIPLKIDDLEEQTITQLRLYDPRWRGPHISPLEVLGLEENLEQQWQGTIYIRNGFTQWNYVHAPINFDL